MVEGAAAVGKSTVSRVTLLSGYNVHSLHLHGYNWMLLPRQLWKSQSLQQPILKCDFSALLELTVLHFCQRHLCQGILLRELIPQNKMIAPYLISISIKIPKTTEPLWAAILNLYNKHVPWMLAKPFSSEVKLIQHPGCPRMNVWQDTDFKEKYPKLNVPPNRSNNKRFPLNANKPISS